MAAGSIAKAYVQIVPSMDGVAAKVGSAFSDAGDKAGSRFGGSFGSKLAGTIKNVIATAGIGKAIGEALNAGAALEQSLGGIETLFGDSADLVIKNAEQAYKTAGMSANSYMEMVTGFSASLLQGLSGDTEKAAAVADMALQDMSDNANKFGTDMESIQNAYQGFAKQNYTMLDNLKLGYGGTKTEMERLLADAQALTGVKYDISNLADVYEAVHVIQEEMGITGTTALEASETFSGSLASMKAAFSDLLANLATGRDIKAPLQAVAETAFTFVQGNLIPMLGNIFTSLPTVLSSAFSMAIRGMNLAADSADALVQSGIDLVLGIGDAIISAVPYLADAAWNIVTSLGSALLNADWMTIGTQAISSLKGNLDLAAGEILGSDGNIVQSVLNAITTNLPGLLAGGVEIVSGIANGILENLPFAVDAAGMLMQQALTAILSALPDILAAGVSLVEQIVTGIVSNAPSVVSSMVTLLAQLLSTIVSHLPNILAAGVSLVEQIVTGIVSNAPSVVSSMVTLLAQLLSTIVSHLPRLLEQGIALVGQLAAGLIRAIPQAVAAIPQIIGQIVQTFASFSWGQIGSDIIGGVARGIAAAGGAIIDAVLEAASAALGAVKRFFGIASPSKVMRDQVGKFIPEGMAVGITANTKPLLSAMDEVSDLTTRAVQADLGKIGASAPVASGNTYGDSTITIHVYAAQGQDEEKIALAVMEKMQHEVSKREVAFA